MIRQAKIRWRNATRPLSSIINDLFENKDEKFVKWVYAQTTHQGLLKHYSIIKRSDKSIFSFKDHINQVVSSEINKYFPDIKVEVNSSLEDHKDRPKRYDIPNWSITYIDNSSEDQNIIARLIINEHFSAWKTHSYLPAGSQVRRENLSVAPDGIIFFNKNVYDIICNRIYSGTESQMMNRNLIIDIKDHIKK